MAHPRGPLRSRALLWGACALAAGTSGCGRERKVVSPVGLYKYGVPREPDLTPVAVSWSSGVSGTTEATATASSASPPAGPQAPSRVEGESPAPPVPGSPATAPAPAAAAPAFKPAPSSESRGYKVVPVEKAGTIRGTCRLVGDASRPPVDVFKDNAKGCGAKLQPTERLVVGAGGALANCLVSVRGIKAGKDFPEDMRSEERTFLLDQKGCRYHPHVGFLRISTQVVVANDDGADHNIHGYLNSVAVTQFNFSSPPGIKIGDAASAFLETPGMYLVKCDIHPWMSAVLHAVTHPYHDVTSAEDRPGRKAGEFVIEGVPAGDWEVVCWHEGMEEEAHTQDGKIASYSYSPDVWGKPDRQGKVTVAAGETATVNFTIDAPPKK